MATFYTYSDLHELLRRVNPLGIRNEDGVVLSFSRQSECIISLLKWIYDKCPWGYIDVPLALMALQRLKPAYAEQIAAPGEIVYIPTWENCDERNKKLSYIIDCFTVATACILQKQDIALALFYLDTYIETTNRQDLTNKIKFELW